MNIRKYCVLRSYGFCLHVIKIVCISNDTGFGVMKIYVFYDMSFCCNESKCKIFLYRNDTNHSIFDMVEFDL